MAKQRRPNIPVKLHQDDREIVGFLTTVLNFQKYLIPTGTAIRSYCTTIPDGFLSLDGSTYSATTYPDLYAAIGTTTLPVNAGFIIRT